MPNASINHRIVLESRPVGMPSPANFKLVETPIPTAQDGEVLTRTLYLSLDPYMRGRMSDAPSYAQPVAVGDVMVGQTVGEVVESRDPALRAGDIVTGFGGWQEHAVLPGSAWRKLDPALEPVTTALGILGMPAWTASYGLLEIGKPKAGETVAVSAASGAVGSVLGQLARIHGCRAVGIAGGEQKCRYVVEELGFDDCVDHRGPDLRAALRAACPSGIDVYFENVGGAVLDAAWPLLNDFARVAVCGLVAQYNESERRPGPPLDSVLRKRLTVKGFIISDHSARIDEMTRALAGWVREGKLKYREDIVEGGLVRAPEAFIGLLQGRNFGKLIVHVG